MDLTISLYTDRRAWKHKADIICGRRIGSQRGIGAYRQKAGQPRTDRMD